MKLCEWFIIFLITLNVFSSYYGSMEESCLEVHSNTIVSYLDGYCYFVEPDVPKRTWEDAEAYCISMGGHLVSIHSLRENGFVLGLYQECSAQYTLSECNFIWLGGTDSYAYVEKDTSEGGYFVWSDGSPWNWDNWYPGGEPNDCTGEDYLMMWNYGGYMGGWNDRANHNDISNVEADSKTVCKVPVLLELMNLDPTVVTYEWNEIDNESELGSTSQRVPSVTDFSGRYTTDPSTSFPPRRRDHASASTEDGFFIFGGFTNLTKGDLWFFDVTSEHWRWVNTSETQKGSDFGSNFTSSSPFPSARGGAGLALLGESLFLFSGGVIPSGDVFSNEPSALFSDLWRFDTLSEIWELLDYKNNNLEYTNQYGSNLFPGSRFRSVFLSWEQESLLVLFGGEKCYSPSLTIGDCGDLWTYNISAILQSQWRFLNVSSITFSGVDFSSSYDVPLHPGSTEYAETGWMKGTDLYLFRSDGVLWRFDFTKEEWSTPFSSHGYTDIISPDSDSVFLPPDDTPGRRKRYSAVSLTTPDDNLSKTTEILLFGGFGADIHGQEGMMGDLWLLSVAQSSSATVQFYRANYMYLVPKDTSLYYEQTMRDFGWAHAHYPGSRSLSSMEVVKKQVYMFGGVSSHGVYGDLHVLNASVFSDCVNPFQNQTVPPTDIVRTCSGFGNCSFTTSSEQQGGKCVCATGASGRYCETVKCGGIHSNDSSVCSGRGDCIGPDTCVCFAEGSLTPLYSGKTCEHPVCENVILEARTFGTSDVSGWVLQNARFSGACGSRSAGRAMLLDQNSGWRSVYTSNTSQLLDPLHYTTPHLLLTPLQVHVSFYTMSPIDCYAGEAGENLVVSYHFFDDFPQSTDHINNVIAIYNPFRMRGKWVRREHVFSVSSHFRLAFWVQNVDGGTGDDVWVVDDLRVSLSPNTYLKNCSSHGLCSSPGTCVCDEGYYGPFCLPECFGIFGNDTENVCNGHGVCQGKDNCKCSEAGTYGENCDIFVCYGHYTNETDEVCNDHGKCVYTDSCECSKNSEGDPLWEGDECETKLCYGLSQHNQAVCSRHGICDRPDHCVCETYYFSKECLECIKLDQPVFVQQGARRKEVQVPYYVRCGKISSTKAQLLFNGSFDCSLVVQNWEEYFSFNYSECYFETFNIIGLEVTERLFLVIYDVEDQFAMQLESEFYQRVGEDLKMYLQIIPLSSSMTYQEEEIVMLEVEVPMRSVPKKKKEEEKGKSVGQAAVIVGSILGAMFGVLALLVLLALTCVIGCVAIGGCGCFVAFCVCTPFTMGGMRVAYLQKKKLKRFSVIEEDINILLKEQEDGTRRANVKINPKLFEIDYNEIKAEEVIGGGGGSDSTIFKARWRGKDVAFKCFKTKYVYSTQEDYSQFEAEITLLASLNHPNLVRFFGATIKPPRVGIVMEFCEQGEVLDFFKVYREKTSSGNEFYPISEKMRMMREIASCVDYIHSQNVIHRDLKAENILLNSSEKCKLIDFGVSRILSQKKNEGVTKAVGTNVYMAPEVLKGDYDSRVDNFSFAILMFVLVTEKANPYGETDNVRIELKVAADPSFRPSLEIFENALGSEKEKYFWLKNVMIRCWDDNPNERISFSELVEIFENEQNQKESHSSRVSRKYSFTQASKEQKTRGMKNNKEKIDNDVTTIMKKMEDSKLMYSQLISKVNDLEDQIRKRVQEKLAKEKKAISEEAEVKNIEYDLDKDW